MDTSLSRVNVIGANCARMPHCTFYSAFHTVVVRVITLTCPRTIKIICKTIKHFSNRPACDQFYYLWHIREISRTGNTDRLEYHVSLFFSWYLFVDEFVLSFRFQPGARHHIVYTFFFKKSRFLTFSLDFIWIINVFRYLYAYTSVTLLFIICRMVATVIFNYRSVCISSFDENGWDMRPQYLRCHMDFINVQNFFL